MKHALILPALALIFLFSCKNGDETNPVYKVIEPGSYLPAYPDSWWKYMTSDSTIIFDSTGDEYVLHNYKINEEPFDKYSEKVYVPVYYPGTNSPLGVSGPIYGYDRIVWFYPNLWQGTWPILREQVGGSFTTVPPEPHIGIYEKVTVTSKYFNGTDSVLVLVGVAEGFEVTDKHVQEFYKGIGLVSDFWIDTVTNDTFSKKLLIDYHISRK